MRSRFVAISTLIACVATASTALGAKPLQLALLPPDVQLVPQDESVTGVRLEIYGRNKNMRGLDLGLVNQVTGSFGGLGFGLANLAKGDASGLDVDMWHGTSGSFHGVGMGLGNVVGGDMTGLNLGIAHLVSGSFKGVSLGLANMVEKNFQGLMLSEVGYASVDGNAAGWIGASISEVDGGMVGLQSGVASLTHKDFVGWQDSYVWNYVGGNMNGFQCGLVNQAASVTGLQLGVVNLAHEVKGVQVGLWNQIDSKEHLKVLPIVNWKF